MDGTLAQLADNDLLYLADTLAGGADRSRMLKALREDEEILRAMVADDRLFDRIAADPEALLRISPRLLFCVLMARVKRDLQHLSYTVEPGHAVIFDAPRVSRLLEDPRILDYLVELLASFVRVNSATFAVRVRPGTWARYRFNDLDLRALIRHTEALEEGARFGGYRRIGDLCLFLAGVFPDSVQGDWGGRARRDLARAACVEHGRSAYRAAARHPRAEAGLISVLARLAETFELAVKPLDHLASHYLGALSVQLFDPR